jgi:D-xylose transport system permease protein
MASSDLLTGLVIGVVQRLDDRISRNSSLHRDPGRSSVWRNVAWYLTSGQTIGPLDANFQLFGGINGTLGRDRKLGVWRRLRFSAFYVLWQSRRAKISHEFPVKPVWAELVIGAIIAVAILGFVAILNSYEMSRPASGSACSRRAVKSCPPASRPVTACRFRSCC